jgi:hypothetical protein
MVRKLWDEMFTRDIELEVLYIWNEGSEEPYYPVFPDGEWGKGPLIEHGQARQVFAALRHVTRPGIVVANGEHDNILAFIKALRVCQHCSDLVPDTGIVERTAVMIEGKVKTVLILTFDTEPS